MCEGLNRQCAGQSGVVQNHADLRREGGKVEGCVCVCVHRGLGIADWVGLVADGRQKRDSLIIFAHHNCVQHLRGSKGRSAEVASWRHCS